MDGKRTMKHGIMVLIASVVACEAIGVLGAIATTPAISTWYVMLRKPAFTPPNWVFGPAWITLYALMGFAVYMAWRDGSKKKGFHVAIAAFAIQLVLNLLWSLLFFGLHSPELGLACIIVLWCAIALTIVLFRRISMKSAWIMLPYLAWVSFAVLLNLYVWMLN